MGGMMDYETITKVLREQMHHTTIAGNTDVVVLEKTDFEAFCDNIDAIHRSLEAENERLRDASERGNDWIKLPVDADGVPIRVGDVVEWRDHSGKWHEQTRVIAITDDGCYLYDSGLFHVNRADIRHIKPDTWESIIEDAIGLGGDGCYSNIDTDRLIVRCRALCERTREGDE